MVLDWHRTALSQAAGQLLRPENVGGEVFQRGDDFALQRVSSKFDVLRRLQGRERVGFERSEPVVYENEVAQVGEAVQIARQDGRDVVEGQVQHFQLRKLFERVALQLLDIV
eukprot:3940020-Rhodomonas_salina.1